MLNKSQQEKQNANVTRSNIVFLLNFALVIFILRTIFSELDFFFHTASVKDTGLPAVGNTTDVTKTDIKT